MVDETEALHGDKAFEATQILRSSLEPRTADQPYADSLGEKNAPKIVLLTRLAERKQVLGSRIFELTDLLV